MDYFSTTIDGIGKVVSVDRELVIAELCDDTFIKSLGIEVLKYVDEAYVVIDNNEDESIGSVEYHIAHICVREDIGMEHVYEIRDAIELNHCEEASIHRRAKVLPIKSDVGTAYSIRI